MPLFSKQQTSSQTVNVPPDLQLARTEQRWASYQPWLERIGYRLRRRYQPGWTPSWLTSGLSMIESEDALQIHIYGQVMDAVRTSDGRRVAMKFVNTSRRELPLWRLITALQSNPQNHCVPILDIHPLPDTDETVMVVMPLLIYYDRTDFETLGELLLCMHTFLEGLVFLHDRNVAHLDISKANAMMDPGPNLFPKGYHPAGPSFYTSSRHPLKLFGPTPHTSRTISPVTYYYIDFGESVWYPIDDMREYITGPVGHSVDAPEFKTKKPFDPFKLDIWALGDMFLTDLVKVYHDIDVVVPLVTIMRDDDPSKRPTAAQALRTLRSIIRAQRADVLSAFIRPQSPLGQRVSWSRFRKHRIEAKLLGRPPIYPEIPGLRDDKIEPLGPFTRLYLQFIHWLP
ncbi:kinase-like protein [Sistotremastrum suecicum HHB10207 ss-3]|uniref:Kinase-like protein n=1 Tax=Sistotremastrum suecicum HHB10207 ss-3 TaxID=1314776 RepID=A0A166FWJ2_9AGAM|nr:kinase-like protein [Sistotremastrum suecicum HHB10207 ss-3]